jgi:hypothetical protein
MLFVGPLSAAEAGTKIELKAEGFDKPLMSRFVGPAEEGGYNLQLSLNHEHLAYMRNALTILATERKPRRAVA